MMRGILLRELPDACLDRLFLLFPDPWPKARHAKRRFVHPGDAAAAGAGAEAGRGVAGGERRSDLPGLGARGHGRADVVRRAAAGDGPAGGLAADPVRGEGAAGRPQPLYWSFSAADRAIRVEKCLRYFRQLCP